MQFSQDTLRLLDQVNTIYPGTVLLRANGDASGVINHDQVSSEVLGSRMAIEVEDTTAPDFTATHELLHMLLALNGYPQLFFQLKVPDDDALTEQMIVMATYLYRPAIHAIIYREQLKHGLLTDAVVSAYVKGVQQELTPETGDNDNDQMALRIMLLLDAKVFLSVVDDTKYQAELAELYPQADASANNIYEAMNIDKITDAFTLHRAVVAAFTTFDTEMSKHGLPLLNAKEFATLTPVLSERQMRLTVNQVFNIKHVELLDEQTMQPAYIGISKQDEQNSFVLSAPEDEQKRVEFFKELYQLSVSELFEQIKQPFTLRS
ncbi:hypothetical protein JOC36_000499 [Weissella uvarum]|uniref:IpaB/EvcA family protein n=1 Tax=Weissella uvarum TaxID=1479233 RepID=UPI0019619493|nr:IpaB/EvcA family protein [Weissella uvarum]MBM7616966.1 hypothetical protein [Weissella uvarum]MCM0594585.1 IpaB/EvcA family protein [Weissella uvarum]